MAGTRLHKAHLTATLAALAVTCATTVRMVGVLGQGSGSRDRAGESQPGIEVGQPLWRVVVCSSVHRLYLFAFRRQTVDDLSTGSEFTRA